MADGQTGREGYTGKPSKQHRAVNMGGTQGTDGNGLAVNRSGTERAGNADKPGAQNRAAYKGGAQGAGGSGPAVSRIGTDQAGNADNAGAQNRAAYKGGAQGTGGNGLTTNGRGSVRAGNADKPGVQYNTAYKGGAQGAGGSGPAVNRIGTDQAGNADKPGALHRSVYKGGAQGAGGSGPAAGRSNAVQGRTAPHKTLRAAGPSPARLLALEALNAVQDGAYSGIALNERLRAARRMSPEDKRLATDLFYGTLENRLKMDYALSQLMQKPTDDAVVREILRMGAYQLLCLDRIPPHAAVSESVELAKRFSRVELAPMVNAVMRSIAEERVVITWPDDPALRLSLDTGTPLWLVERLRADMGEVEADAFLRYRPEDFFTTVHFNPHAIDNSSFEHYLKRENIRFRKGSVPGAYRVQGGDIGARDGFKRGLFSIQSESSMLAALAVGARPGMNILDACAAPGGKACLMAESMGASGRVHAWDIHEHRVRLIQENARRLSLENVRPQQRDALEFREQMVDSMDAVIVDAPCSNLGAMAGKPDLKYRLTPEELEGLPPLQTALLDMCARYVKPGGALVYSTCTVLRAENEGIVEAFLRNHPDFAPGGLEHLMPEHLRIRVKDDGILTLLPHIDGLDGFFITRMVRSKKGARA